MKNSLETRLGLFFALVCVAGFLLYEMAGGISFLKRGRTVNARFAAVQDLKVGDPVKLAGVPVGRVTSLRVAPDEARVEVAMSIQSDAPVKTDSTATIQFTGLMGQNFVSISFGSAAAPLATAGAVLTSREQPDLSQLMSKLEGVADGVQNMTKSFSGEEFSKLFGPLTDLLRENNPRFTTILSNFAQVSGQIAQGKGTFGKLIQDEALYTDALITVTNLKTASSRLEGLVNNTQTLVTDARGAVAMATNLFAGMNRGEGTMGKLLKDETLYNEATTMMTNLREVTQKMNRGEGTVGKLINDDSFLKNLKMTLQKVDKATEGLEDTGPLSIIGSAVQTIF